MNSKVERKGKYRDLKYLVLGLPMGHRCGYVKIPRKHPLHGLSYSEQLPITFKQFTDEYNTIGKRGVVTVFCAAGTKPEDRISMDLLFDVHGGITFSGELKNQDGWWIGFDCAHAGDGRDPELMDEKHKQIYVYFPNFGDEVIRTADYVEEECKRLIDQINKWFNHPPQSLNKE